MVWPAQSLFFPPPQTPISLNAAKLASLIAFILPLNVVIILFTQRHSASISRLLPASTHNTLQLYNYAIVIK